MLGIAAVIAISLVCALGAAFCYILLIEHFDPLEIDEAAGPQFARAFIALIFALAGFVVGTILSIVAWVSINVRRSSKENAGRPLLERGE